ncbi:MAG TPA: glucarate dehydratase family protein [Solirubrobacteraceae bacterium]|nr:glucarate dehydratase family protein [Solirubrobacteraceae bacterium]
MPVIERVRITPVAFADPPLLNAVGVHQPFALRAVLQLETGAGLEGLGETYADKAHLRRLHEAGRALIGYDVFDLNGMYAAVRDALAGERGSDGHGLTGMITTSSTVDRVFSSFEVAALDVQGQSIGRPVSDLLGGAVRAHVPFSAYLFYKWAAHPGAEPDGWGEALTPEAIVAQAARMTHEYGFHALKLKGGVMDPDEEIAAVRALRERFPELPIRLDPNAAWSVATSLRVAGELAGVLEYLEDPTRGQEAMARVAAQAPMPLATNMCVVAFEEVASAAKLDPVSIVLSDHHYWGGLGRSRLLAGICETLGWGLSMHSNSHLGISLAAMVHLAAATPNLTYACDTHWPWKTEDVVAGEPFRFRDGALAVPTEPGLGVRLDTDLLGELHEQYLRCGIRDRDDTGYRRSLEPGYAPRTW